MSRTVRAADGIWWMRTLLANVVFVGSSERWVLVDAGIGGYSGAIAAAARELFGDERPPEAIILTHGHFDHVGSLKRLLQRWDVPVYAHTLELPYLTGRSSYPPPDPTADENGVVALPPPVADPAPWIAAGIAVA